MALRNLFNRAQAFAKSQEGRRLINQGKDALRQRGSKGRGAQGVRPQSGSKGIMDMAERFLGRGGSAGPTHRH